MSYILDALKKSEKERRRGTVPDLLTVQGPSLKKPERHYLWIYIAMAVLLVNAGMFIWWNATWKTKKTDGGAETTAFQQSIPAVKEAPLPQEGINDKAGAEGAGDNNISGQQKTAVKPPDAIHDSREAQTMPSSEPYVRNTPPPAVMPALNDIPPDAVPAPSPEQAADEQKAEDIRASFDKGKIYALNELPLSIRQKLPDFNITASIYSDDPGLRMVRINGQMMHEGQDLTPDIKIEEIVQNGVVLNFRKFRFLVGVK
jgi:general secretion pathway protein B